MKKQTSSLKTGVLRSRKSLAKSTITGTSVNSSSSCRVYRTNNNRVKYNQTFKSEIKMSSDVSLYSKITNYVSHTKRGKQWQRTIHQAAGLTASRLRLVPFQWNRNNPLWHYSWSTTLPYHIAGLGFGLRICRYQTLSLHWVTNGYCTHFRDKSPSQWTDLHPYWHAISMQVIRVL